MLVRFSGDDGHRPTPKQMKGLAVLPTHDVSTLGGHYRSRDAFRSCPNLVSLGQARMRSKRPLVVTPSSHRRQTVIAEW
jgi:hypothetical protein